MTTMLALAAFVPVAAILWRWRQNRKAPPSGSSMGMSLAEEQRRMQALWATVNKQRCGSSPEPGTHREVLVAEPKVHTLVRELLGPEAEPTCTCKRVTKCVYPDRCPMGWIHHELTCPVWATLAWGAANS